MEKVAEFKLELRATGGRLAWAAKDKIMLLVAVAAVELAARRVLRTAKEGMGCKADRCAENAPTLREESGSDIERPAGPLDRTARVSHRSRAPRTGRC